MPLRDWRDRCNGIGCNRRMRAMYTVAEVATKLKISRSSVYFAIESGTLPHYRFGAGRGTIRVSEEQLQEFLDGAKAERISTSGRLKDITYRGKSPS